MFLARFWMHQYSRGKAVAAYYVPPTQLVIVGSWIMRHCMLLHCLRHVIASWKTPYVTPTFSIYFILSRVESGHL